jgi:cytochrome c biogenesis protein CcmG/thiol:disulfide interchange protein DsbE
MKAQIILATLLGLISVPTFAADYPAYVTAKNLYATTDLRGKQVPALSVQEWLSGAPPQTAGKVVLIDLWATWCPPCRALVPELNEYQKKFGHDLVVIGISDEAASTVKKFMKDNHMEYNVAVDTSKNLKDQLGVSGIPHVLIMSPDGIVRWQGFPGSSEDPLTEQTIAQIIEASKKH